MDNYQAKAMQKRPSALRRALREDQIDNMLLFLCMLNKFTAKCQDTGRSPDISSFILAYKEIDYISLGAESIQENYFFRRIYG